MTKFEIPFNFNFDGEYFNLLDERKELFQRIDCIYMPSFEKGGLTNTRVDLVKYPKSEEEYVGYIREFQKRNIDVTILMQKNSSMEMVGKYHNEYGINDFTINNNELAFKIKEKYPNIKLRLSITAKATVDDINNHALDAYDNIVLFFWFNRHLDVIKKLPKTHEYSVLCNTRCLYNCPYCDRHWFEVGYRVECMDEKIYSGIELDFNRIAFIRPCDLKYFEDYVSVFKLEGRECISKGIFAEFDKYILLKEIKRPLGNFNYDDIISNYNKKDDYL